MEEGPLHGPRIGQKFFIWIFNSWGHVKSLVYAAAVDNEEALHHAIVYVCQTISSYPCISERIGHTMIRCVEA